MMLHLFVFVLWFSLLCLFLICLFDFDFLLCLFHSKPLNLHNSNRRQRKTAECCNLAKNADRESTTMGPNWLELPSDLTLNILQRLGAVEIVTTVCQVCPLWRNICKDPLMWRTIHMTKVGYSYYDLEKICRYAVDRSCGLLEDIHIECFGTDEILKYIADCASNLRRLRLVECWRISDKGFREAVRKLPLLEEIDIEISFLYKDSLEIIGRCCPLLKSLKLQTKVLECITWDDDAIVIAKSMPKLRHLKMPENLITNVGILAILDGCPLLESLDLQNCLDLELSGSLAERCREQIKDLRLPMGYTTDNRFYWPLFLADNNDYDPNVEV